MLLDSQAVGDLLRTHPAFEGWQLEPIRTIRARHSQVVEYRGRTNGRAIIAKSIVRSTSSQHADGVMSREYAAISKLRASLAGPILDTFPEPLLMLPGQHTFVMSKVPGVPLAREIKRRANAVTFWRWRSMTTASLRTGTWLRDFQDATQRPARGFEPEPYLAAIEKLVSRCAGNGWPSEQAETVMRRARVAAEDQSGQPVRQAARQGDFSPQNILVDGERVRIVDFENFAESDAVYEDVCSYTAYLRMLGSSPLYSSRALRAMTTSFLEGYGSPLQPRLFAMYELRLALAVLAEFLGRSPGRSHQGKRAGLQSRVLDIAEALETGARHPA
jgi:hypothetical protein